MLSMNARRQGELIRHAIEKRAEVDLDFDPPPNADSRPISQMMWSRPYATTLLTFRPCWTCWLSERLTSAAPSTGRRPFRC